MAKVQRYQCVMCDMSGLREPGKLTIHNCGRCQSDLVICAGCQFKLIQQHNAKVHPPTSKVLTDATSVPRRHNG